MNNELRESLLKLQQGELDGVVLYKTLSELEEFVDIKAELLKMAADEGRHASILKGYTNETLKPSNQLAKTMVTMLKDIGKNKLFEILSEGELKGGPVYEALGEHFEALKDVAKDEVAHAKKLKEFIK